MLYSWPEAPCAPGLSPGAYPAAGGFGGPGSRITKRAPKRKGKKERIFFKKKGKEERKEGAKKGKDDRGTIQVWDAPPSSIHFAEMERLSLCGQKECTKFLHFSGDTHVPTPRVPKFC